VASYQPPAQPRGLLRWGYKLPLILYRLDLGWLLGHRFLLLVHRGRVSGQIHRTVLEVVGYDPSTRESKVVSAYGERADWYRNIQAHPPIAVLAGRDKYTPRFRLLDPDERLVALTAYQRRYSRAFGMVMRFLGHDYDGSAAGLRALADTVVMVAFSPIGTASPT
jgi:deazaflavin-dependent oxidoreductase (nitroreductase family)